MRTHTASVTIYENGGKWYLRGQEIRVVLASDLAREILRRQVIFVPLRALRGLLGQFISLLLEQLERISLVDALALGGGDAVADPLPQLAARHLSGGGVLPKRVESLDQYLRARLLPNFQWGFGRYSHQVVDGHATYAADPSLHVAQSNVKVLPDTLLRDLARDVHVQQVILADLNILTAVEELVGSRHVLVEDFRGNGGQGRVSHPCSKFEH